MAKRVQKEVKKDEQVKKPVENTQDVTRPDTSAAENKIEEALGNVEVVSGAESQILAIAGHTVQDVRDYLRDVLNISQEAQARVDGNLVDGDHVLQADETLEFVKTSGQKGP